MRLTAIKLAGFKSFVEPTHIPVGGQLVGIVGPNGCGKSNVIDAVRWVLGESQARQLRGANMTDVIFNGSASRRAVSRASVELSFDNSDGKAPGPWAAYAEISVKRVLTRQSESSYYINNQLVRRRDMVDIFLGTGLGAKTPYAIIEQGMISRIIEARPEELRGFLEEAAGISKYKERRRETETRLHSTRENLLRLDDIRQVLTEQIERLQSQAETALTYNTWQQELTAAQQILWFVKQRDALAKFAHFDQQIGQIERQLEEKNDALRGAAHQIEMGRAAYADANKQLHEAQGDFYAAVAEVSRLEQTVRHLGDTRLRLQAQAQQLTQRRETVLQQSRDSETGLAQRQQRSQQLQLTIAEAAQSVANLALELPQIETALRDTRQQLAARQQELSGAEQAIQINETQLQHLGKALQQFTDRQTRLQQEDARLAADDNAALAAATRKLDEATVAHDRLSEQLNASQTSLAGLEAQRQPWRTRIEQHNRTLHQAEGELAGLNKVQRQMTAEAHSDDWLTRRQLNHAPKLWQQIEVASGWEKAVEIALGLRLQAVATNAAGLDMADIPAGGASLFDAAAQRGIEDSGALPRLLDKVTIKAGAGGALQDWLEHFYTAEDVASARALRERLPRGAQIICPQGHVFTRHGQSYAAKSGQTSGILARQKDIDALVSDIAEISAQKALVAEQLNRLEADIQRDQQELSLLRQQHGRAQQQLHQCQIESAKLHQVQQRVAQRRDQIVAELNEIATSIQSEQQEYRQAETQLAQHRALAARLRPALEEIRAARKRLEADFEQQREQHRQSERKLQEMRFSLELESSKINEMINIIKAGEEESARLQLQHADALSELAALDDTTHTAALGAAIAQRQSAEHQLALGRQQMEDAGAQLRLQEETRMRLEQSLAPLRNQLEALRLQRQEASLLAQQCEEQLLTWDIDRAELSGRLASGVKTAGLNQEIERLTRAIASLGAVNLAAVQELEQAAERSQYLQAQAQDLEQAMETLSAVMTTIDAETRELFKTTFDLVNRSMAELFTTLFDGGQAELRLTGDEWLDAGVQVFAQPPGKKNNSIHLLSGGEKALTALSLVFALFKLTPAPFCILDEVDAPLDDSNTERYTRLVKQMSAQVQFLFITHNRITMEAAEQLIGVTMQEQGVSRTVSVDLEQATRLAVERN